KGNVNSYLAHYGNGKKNGVQKFWYPNGQLQTQQNYDADVLVYEWKWFENGRPKQLSYYKNGLPDGTWRTYADPAMTSDTLPVSIDNYSNGMKNGLHSGYSHGKLSEEIFYKDDKLDGTYKKWDTNGMLGISENYVNGNREGLCKYFNHGKCIREANYSKGKMDGAEKEYDDGGKLFRISWYNQGRVDSTSNYFPNGQKSVSRIYKYYPGFVKTEEFSDYTEWDAQGHLLLKGTYHFEEKEKTWTTYYPGEKIKSITPYSNGKISGVYKKWYANGKELIEMECEGNEVTTAPKVWDEKGKPIKAGTKQYQEIVDSSKPGEIYNDPKKYKENRTQEVIYDQVNVTQEGENEIPVSDVPVDRIVEENPGEVFTYAEVMPEFPGGSSEMVKFIQDNIKYPSVEKESGKTGTVYVQFVVEEDGSLSNIHIVKSVSGAPGFDKEAIRVISIMPKWIPGKMNGKTVRVQIINPVRFQLQ
ncbi:MAG TPA: TonB family protein, partial [Bacteroidia bacterium]|nr:TonB family protein [Bacteroidia bacterium]